MQESSGECEVAHTNRRHEASRQHNEDEALEVRPRVSRFQKSRADSEAARIYGDSPPGRPDLPRTRLWIGRDALGPCLEAAGELGDDALPVARALCLDPNLVANHQDDAQHLSLCSKPVWIEAIGWPREVIVHAVERHAEKMLDLLRRTLSVPAARLVGAGDGRQEREDYSLAGGVHHTGLAHALEWRACHRLGMWSLPTLR